VKDSLNKLQQILKERNLQGIIFTGTDPHLSEYPPAYYLTRAQFSGFQGSAGILSVTQDGGALWSDSRYYIEGAQSLKGTGLSFYKSDSSEDLPLEEWLSQNLPPQSRVALDFSTASVAQVEKWKRVLEQAGHALVHDTSLVDMAWLDRPEIPGEPVFELSSHITGKVRKETIKNFQQDLSFRGIDYLPITAVDQLAWLLDLRGYDVSFNPVFIGYCIIGQESCRLFIDSRKIEESLQERLVEDGVEILPYEDFYTQIGSLTGRILLDRESVNYHLINSLSPEAEIVEGLHPVALAKNRKNPVEIEGFRKTMEKDGRAMVRFLKWFEEHKSTGITEKDCAAILETFRASEEDYYGPSFETISAVNAHGAIPHYRLTDESNDQLPEEGLFLLDSGGQYFQGTTDITRTLGLQKVTEEMKHHYTLVLKGHLRVARIPFPKGTNGSLLDSFARADLWAQGLNYGHGTGHGVGHFLNVHEDPARIRPLPTSIGLDQGMVLSNEPGLYIEDRYGIRIENMILAVPFSLGEGDFLCWEDLTLCPYERDLILPGVLEKNEIDQINNYHETVYTRLAPLLEEKERQWLRNKTQPITQIQKKG